MKSPLRIAVVFTAALTAQALFAAKPPAWLDSELEKVADETRGEAAAVVLQDEATYDFNEKGVSKREARWAVKIYDLKERDRAIARVYFEEGYSQVTHFRTWLIQPDGKVYRYEKKDAWDVAVDSSDLHSSRMRKVHDASGSVREGSVFAFEYKLKKKSVFSQFVWTVQQDVPVVRSELRVVPPQNWTVEGTLLNGLNAEASIEGKEFVWKSEMVAPFQVEASAPSSESYIGLIGLDLRPSDRSDRSFLLSFSNWNEVATYDASVNDTQIEPTEAIKHKVAELCDDLEDEWASLEAIGEYAQSVNYVSISTDLALGGGYRPFTADEVFRRHYGDCKDKTALMRSMLKCLGKTSYAVSVDVGGDAYVNPEWPSLYQFNHCIVAIPVSDAIEAPAVVEDDLFGRLLIFDPTSQLTPFGMLPRGMGRSQILVGSSETQGLIELPGLSPEENKVVRRLDLELTHLGNVSGTLKESSIGDRALLERGHFDRRSKSDYKDMLEGWLSNRGISARVGAYSLSDDFNKNVVQLELDFQADGVARSMRDRFLVLRPFLVDRVERPEHQPDERTLPFVLTASLSEEFVTYSIPEGFVLDDAPKPLVLETDFARYEMKIKSVEGKLECTRVLRQVSREVPIDDYEAVYAFYDEVARAEQTPVVLARK